MLLLFSILAIWLTWKFFTSWVWWIIGIMLLIALWHFLTSWPVLLLIALFCFVIAIKQFHQRAIGKANSINKAQLSGNIKHKSQS